MTKYLSLPGVVSVSVFLSVSVFNAHFANAELKALDDSQLASVEGAGIGLVLEDFAFEAGEDVAGGNRLDIGGITNADGEEVVLSISQFYVAGSGSNQGVNVIGNPVNLGRLLYPYNIELVDGDTIGIYDKAVFEFSAPERLAGSSSKPYSLLGYAIENRSERRFPDQAVASGSRVDAITGIDTSVLTSRAGELADMGIRFDLEENGVRAQSLEAHAQGVAVDGSYLRLWGDNNEMIGNLALNLYVQDLSVFACDADGNNCGQNIHLQNLIIESELGYGADQPVTFEVASDGNFTVEVGSIEGKSDAFYQDYYANGPRTDIHIGNLTVGNTDFGSSTIANLQIQYLRATSRDL